MSKRALVTGASSGIGLEFARILARGGYDLFLVARNGKKLDEVAEELRNRYETEVEVMPVDLSRPNSAEKVYTAAASKDEIEILINNAGFSDLGYFTEANWDRLHEMINLNILSLTYLAQLTAKDMQARGRGRILNVASSAAFMPGPKMAVYHASKSYVLSFSLALHEELRKSGVTVTALMPGIVRTGFQEAMGVDDMDKTFQNRNRMYTPYEVAQDGYQAMMDGRPMSIPGGQIKLINFLSRITPRRWGAKLVHRTYRRRDKEPKAD
ncbi:MAG: SDR family oxidoreductase [Candidatus Saccharimonadales bacterium]|nr:SDR family oxidoreductase [Candidatus Saccharimonadales bacterium]